jgi:hypothetical protein
VFAAFRFGEFGFGGYQFALKGFRQDPLSERLDALASGSYPSFKSLGKSEHLTGTPYDFRLLRSIIQVVQFGTTREMDLSFVG